jgi:hypothetical protein
MSIFGKLKNTTVANRKSDEMLYSVVAAEMADGVRYEGLWLKAVQLSAGDQQKQHSEYIKLRIQSLKDDVHILSNMQKTQPVLEKVPDIEPLISLIENGTSSSELAQYFLKKSEKTIKYMINLQDACEEYPLHVAVKNNKLAMAEWLLNAGADQYVKNYWNRTPMDIATDKEDIAAIALLENHTK